MISIRNVPLFCVKARYLKETERSCTRGGGARLKKISGPISSKKIPRPYETLSCGRLGRTEEGDKIPGTTSVQKQRRLTTLTE